MKTLAEQKDQLGQKLKLEIQLSNGEPLNLDRYLRALVKSQSLAAWRCEPEQFRTWIAEQVASHIKNSEVKIWQYGN